MEQDEYGRKRLRDELDRADHHFPREIERAVAEDPELRQAQDAHDQLVEVVRKRQLEVDEIHEAMRAMDRKRVRPLEVADGALRGRRKRGLEDACDGDEVRGDVSLEPPRSTGDVSLEPLNTGGARGSMDPAPASACRDCPSRNPS